jgi:hypothetical protein
VFVFHDGFENYIYYPTWNEIKLQMTNLGGSGRKQSWPILRAAIINSIFLGRITTWIHQSRRHQAENRSRNFKTRKSNAIHKAAMFSMLLMVILTTLKQNINDDDISIEWN